MKLKIEKDHAQQAYDNADSAGKKMLEDLFPSVEFKTDPYINACRILGKTPEPPLEDRSDSDEVSKDAYGRLIICIRAKNLLSDGSIWVPKYDGTENHYFPVLKPDPSGVGFSYSHSFHWCTLTFVGARLEYRSEKLMREGVAEFAELYNDYLTFNN